MSSAEHGLTRYHTWHALWPFRSRRVQTGFISQYMRVLMPYVTTYTRWNYWREVLTISMAV